MQNLQEKLRDYLIPIVIFTLAFLVWGGVGFLLLTRTEPAKEISAPNSFRITPLSLEDFPKIYQEFRDSPVQNQKIAIFDLRSNEEYVQGHLTGVFNLPVSVLKEGNFYLPRGDVRIIFYATDENLEAEIPKENLAAKGIQEVQILREPYSNWQAQFSQEMGDSYGE